jgi:hypothetical protein
MPGHFAFGENCGATVTIEVSYGWSLVGAKKSFYFSVTNFAGSALYEVKAVMKLFFRRRLVMKSTRLTSILGSSLIASALAIGSLASTQVASAQIPSAMAEVTIPFDFQNGTQALPAGTYRIVRSESNLVRLQGSGSAGGFVLTHDATRAHASKLGTVVFDRYGDKYYLHQIWTAGSTDGFECAKSRAEKHSMLARNMQAPSTVELALNEIPSR